MRGRARLLRKDRQGAAGALQRARRARNAPEPWLQGRTLNNKKGTAQRETLRKEVVSLFAFVSRQNDWFAEKSFYDIIIFR